MTIDILIKLAYAAACISHGKPTEDIGAQLAKFRQVNMPFAAAGLSTREKQMVNKLVEASRDLESIYWRQSDPEGLALYQGLAGCTSAADKQLRRFILINGSHYDLLSENKAFI